MRAEQDVGSQQIRTILRDWYERQCDLYAIVFDSADMQNCAGRLSYIDDEIARITDSFVQLRIPYASASDCAVVTLDDKRRSVTLTWRDGKNAFIVRRPERESQPNDR